jgi:1-acyl-sn-glycerol-3-phosphate acyltransferase
MAIRSLRSSTPDTASSRVLGDRPERETWLDDQVPHQSAARYGAVRAFVGRVARIYSRVRVEGLDHLPDGASVLCFTHQSWADPFYMFAAVPNRPRMYFFGPVQEEMRHGVRNRLMRWSGVVIPYRPGRRGLVAATARAEWALARDAVVVIAGEGRIHSGETVVLPLRDGAAYLSLRAGVPLVPVAINGTSWLGFRRAVRIRVGEPIPAHPATPTRPTPDEVAGLTCEAQAALEALVADFPDRPLPGLLGRRLTELFNDWPDGSRPPAQVRQADFGGVRPSSRL